MSIRWPKYAGDYPLDEEISRRTIAEGLYDILLHPETHLGLPVAGCDERCGIQAFSEGIKDCNQTIDHAWVG